MRQFAQGSGRTVGGRKGGQRRARILLRQGVRVLSDHSACEAVIPTKEE